MKLTFIGLGKMGSAMVERLLEQGHQVTVYNRTAKKMEPLVALGASPAKSISEAVQHADVILSSLLDDKAALTISDQVIEHMKPEAIYVGLSTILPDTAKALAEKHRAHQTHYIAATVLGVPLVARAGELTTYVSGPQKHVEKVRPALQAFSKNIEYLGENIIDANVIKICMNYSLITTIELISELYVFAEKSGMDVAIVKDALHQVFGHPAFKRYVDKIYQRDFKQVNFDMVGGNKDVSIFQDAFSRVGVAPEIANIVKSRFTSALANNMQDDDWSAIYEVVRRDAGLKE